VIPTLVPSDGYAEHLFGEHDPLSLSCGSENLGFQVAKFGISDRSRPTTVIACPAMIEPGVSSSWVPDSSRVECKPRLGRG
jgi:hypothetical protein